MLSERELHSRYEIFLENYHKTINIESQLTIQIAQRMILPAAFATRPRSPARSPISRPPVHGPETQIAL